MKPFRIGILGGMGPLAGLELHRLIIEATPAASDQDHLQVVLFTDPNIPDRTYSLLHDNGEKFSTAAAKSAKVLEDAGADCIAMACMTAHSRIQKIQDAVSIPVINGIEITQQTLEQTAAGKKVALLATNGSIKAGVYTYADRAIEWMIPDNSTQQLLMDGIYSIKSGDFASGSAQVTQAAADLTSKGAEVFVLGCTELGLLHDQLSELGHVVADPQRLLAGHLVEIALAKPVAVSPYAYHAYWPTGSG
jgi:aspartate racemase